MNIISNNKLLLLSAVGTFMMSGCVAQKNFQRSSFAQPKSVVKKSKSWKSIRQDRDDCPDCYASGMGVKKSVSISSSRLKEQISYDYSKTPTNLEDSYVAHKSNISAPSYVDNVIDTKRYGVYDYSVSPTDTYIESENSTKVTPKLSYVNSSRDSFNTKLTSDTTIQVGAFRHYSGAKKIAKKYSLLSSQYSVKIETGTKGGVPIHRVRISGFHSKGQAKAFMHRYAINDAFLVRR